MIRLNLAKSSRKKMARVAKEASSKNLLPFVLGGIVIATVAGGFLWYSSLSSQTTDLESKIAQANAQKAQLEAVIKQDQIYESRKKELENRIKIIEGLRRNQVSPVVSLDALGEAVNKTQFVWLSSLDQNNTTFSMSGVGTSVNALADLVSNLEGTGYFRNINLVNAQDAAGNFNFSMTCEFSPPSARAASSTAGAN